MTARVCSGEKYFFFLFDTGSKQENPMIINQELYFVQVKAPRNPYSSTYSKQLT